MTETFFPVRTPALGVRHRWLKTSPDREHGLMAITIANGQGVIPDGGVVAKMTCGAASAEALAGNTGNGALTLDVTTPTLSDVKPGVYKVRITAAASNGGRYEVMDPTGVVIGSAAVGDTWAKGVKFVIADDDPDFAVGDGWDITVAPGSGKWGWYDPEAVDGRATPGGLLFYRVDATADDVEVACVIRRVAIAPHELSWHDNVDSQGKKDAALAILARSEIEARHTL